MQTMRAATRTVFVQFYATGVISSIFVGVVVALIAFSASQRNEYTVTFFSHGLRILLRGKGKAGSKPKRLLPENNQSGVNLKGVSFIQRSR